MAIVKVIEVLAESENSWDDAVNVALKQAQKSVKNIQSIYAKEFQAIVEDGEIKTYRLNAKISFIVDN
ncbi:MAG: dodecin family protein [Anaerolineae bacterium]